ncbi:TPA: phosphoribosyltransferase [Methanosarcinaceae archaeon]|nr:phosphoribosyltransferase [Methanosarcinaceae archaeon]
MCSSKLRLFENHVSESELLTFKKGLLEAFKNDIIKNMDKWDLVLVVGQKGLFIFEDMISELEENITYISNFEINFYGRDYFENKRILIFDDTINSGKTIGKQISILSQHCPKSLTVAVISTTIEKCRDLSSKYPDVNFLSYNKFSTKEDFCEFFLLYIREYLDSICMPKCKKDLIVDEFVHPGELSKKNVKDLFSIEKSFVEDGGMFLENKNRFKMVLEFCDEDRRNLKESIFPEILDFEVNPCKVRLYVHVSKMSTKIFIEYVILPELADFSGCKKALKHKYHYCSGMNENLNRDCLICAIYNLTEKVRDMILNNISEKKVKGNFKKVLWFYEGKIIYIKNFE